MSTAIVSDGGPVRRTTMTCAALLAAIVAMVALGTGRAAAQDVATPGDGRLTMLDARLTGDGPWTSWLGGPAERRLLLVVENTGDAALGPLVVELRQGKGSPDRALEPLEISPLEPGERVSLQAEVRLDPFAFGTHAVVGEIDGGLTPVVFRAETTHVPWALLLLPTLVLVQLTLVALRNVARRRLQREQSPPVIPTAAPTRSTRPADSDRDRLDRDDTDGDIDLRDDPLRSVVHAELDTAFDRIGIGSLDEPTFAAGLEREAAEATARVAEQLGLDDEQRPALAAEITTALLERLHEAEPVG